MIRPIMNNEQEIWKDVAGYEGRYMVSSFGRVKSFIGREKILSHYLSKHGYPCLRLCLKRKKLSIRIHRLVAVAFIPNPLKHPFINHINGIKTDNRIENLEWCDAHANALHAKQPKQNNLLSIRTLEEIQKETVEMIDRLAQRYGLVYEDVFKLIRPKRKQHRKNKAA